MQLHIAEVAAPLTNCFGLRFSLRGFTARRWVGAFCLNQVRRVSCHAPELWDIGLTPSYEERWFFGSSVCRKVSVLHVPKTLLQHHAIICHRSAAGCCTPREATVPRRAGLTDTPGSGHAKAAVVVKILACCFLIQLQCAHACWKRVPANKVCWEYHPPVVAV